MSKNLLLFKSWFQFEEKTNLSLSVTVGYHISSDFDTIQYQKYTTYLNKWFIS